MAQNITLLGASYTAVPAVTLPKTGGGTAKFSDASVTTAVESDVAEGKTFLLANGEIGIGTASGGGGGSGYTRTVICPEQTVVSTSPPEDDTDMLLLTSTDDLVEGDYYLVTVNGTERVQTAVRNNYVLYLADITDAWWDGNRMVIMASGDIYFCPWAAGTYTVKVEHLELDGSGGGGSATLITKTITANGTYSASDDSADGYSEVTVNVPSSAASSWTKVAETTYQVSTTNTSAKTVATWATGHSEIWTSDKILYIRIRDTAGKRTGYFYGVDAWVINRYPKNPSLSTYAQSSDLVYQIWRVDSNGEYAYRYGYNTQGYGVYPDTIYKNGSILIRNRYSSSYSLTVNGTYKVEVYLLDPPTGTPIFT